MSQYRGPDALKFVYSLNHYYGELVVKLHGLFNVSSSFHTCIRTPRVTIPCLFSASDTIRL